MADFILNRVNASQWDLKTQEEQDAFEALRVYVRVMGKARPLTDTVILNLIMDHGPKKADGLVKAFIQRGFFALPRLQGLIDGTEPFEFKPRPESELKPSTRWGKQQGEPRSLESLLGGIAKKAEQALASYPTDDHVYNGAAAGEWMRKKEVSFEHFKDYFSILPQRDADGTNLLQLKSEYR